MAILNPSHLLEQADKLVAPPPNGPPRQVDIRRAISSAYYAVFHLVAAAAADRYVGASRRAKAEYGLVYRSIDHRRLKELCVELSKQTPPKQYQQFIPATGMSPFFSRFAAAVVELQEQRHTADYDPMVRLKTANAQAAVKTARSAVQRFPKMSKGSRDVFVSLLVFQTRK